MVEYGEFNIRPNDSLGDSPCCEISPCSPFVLAATERQRKYKSKNHTPSAVDSQSLSLRRQGVV